MGTNTLQANRPDGAIVEAADVNEFRTALIGAVIPRDSTTRVPSHDADDLGSATARWNNAYIKNLILNGVSLSSYVLKATGIDIVVDAAGTGDYTGIQAAITASSPGDVILILNGTYTGDISFYKNLTVFGQGHETKIIGDIVIKSHSTIEKVNFSDATKKISFGWRYDEEEPEEVVDDALCFVKCWLNGAYDGNIVIQTGQNPELHIQYYSEA